MDRFPPPHPIYPPVIHYGPAPIPLRKEPHIPLTPKTGMRREEIERRLEEINVTAEEKAAWNAKYAKPSTGIPKTDLASGVQASLGKADTALQEHQSLSGYVQKSVIFDNPDTTPTVKSALLPSYVDDVLEYASLSAFPSTGETGKIYVAKDTNKTYRWGGTQYVQVGGDEQAQADWAQTNSSSPDFIKNKPTIPAAQVQANWNETDTSSKAFIQNKPTIPTVPTNVSAFTNDAGYLTQHQSLSAYRTASAQDAIDGAQNTAIAAKYTKPATGIPASDLAAGVIPTAPVTSVNDKTGAVVLSASDIGDGSGGTVLGGLQRLDSTKANAASIAPAFDASSTYAVGDYVTHEGLLYRCTTAVSTAGAWDAANWTAVSAMDEMPAAQVNADWNAASGVAQILNKPTIPSAKPTHIYNAAGVDALDDKGQLFVSTVGGNYWTGSNSVVFDYQNYSDRGWGGIGSTYNWKQNNSNLWLCYKSETGIAYKQNFSSGTWHTENRGSAGVGLDPTAGDVLADLPDFFATNNGLVFHKKEAILSSSPYAHFALESLPDRTWAAGTWNVGDLVKYDGKAYRCIAAATSSNTSAPSSDTTHWAQISLLSDKADSTAIRYAFASPTPTVSGTAATVACEDRAINDFTVATGITSLTITPPAAVTGRARDFFCRVTLTDSSLPTVTLSGATIDIGSTEVAGMTQGVNLLMFTEIASGHWLASRRSTS